jgi:tRNA-dihydrouridine synthase B
VCDLLLEHVEALYHFYGRQHGVRIARKHISWYSKTRTGGAEFRARINRAESPTQQRALIRNFFDRQYVKGGLAA